MSRKTQDEKDVKQPDKMQRHQPNQDEVDEASIESFPASDAPGWSGTTTSKPKTKDKKSDKG